MARSPTPETPSVVGAIIFFSYIAAALAVTGTIVYDLASLYKTKSRTPQQTQNGVRKLRLQSSILMTILSFSTLSYHMLSFLIDSYSAWSLKRGTALPESVLGDRSIPGVSGTRTDLQIWQWATSATLFQDFAEAIIGDPKSQFWTVKVLLFSFVWNCYMAERGESSNLRHRLDQNIDCSRPTSTCSKALGVFCNQSDFTRVVLPEPLHGSMPAIARPEAHFGRD